MVDLDQFRLDVDEAMAMAQEAAASESERRRVKQVWLSIENQLTKGGPFAEMLIQFRQDAVSAMSEMVHADPTDTKLMASLQADVRRSLRTMEMIDSFSSAAKAADANDETIVSVDEE
jgi:type II secretory pathway component PulF